MKSLFKKASSAILAVTIVISVCTLNVFAAEPTYQYKLNSDSTAVITGCTGSGTVSSIPSVIGGHKVVAIGDYAFSDPENKGITFGTSLTIPSTVQTIGEGAFEYNITTTSVTFPSSLKRIGENAFFSCRALTKITFSGNSLTEIADFAFKGCESVTTLTLPSSLKKIGKGAFSYNTGLTSVDIPFNVTSIGKNAFLNCYSMTSAVINNSSCSIGKRVFDLTKSTFVLSGYAGSTAETYASENSHSFKALSDYNGRENLEHFIKVYEEITANPNKYCNSENSISEFSSTYTLAGKILSNHTAYSASTISQTESKAGTLEVIGHTFSYTKTPPANDTPGKECYVCGNCGANAGVGKNSNGEPTVSFDEEPITIPAPSMCSYKNNYYDYSRHSAGLKYDNKENTQSTRFPASMNVPVGAEISDFGFIFTQTKFLNGGEEPEDNNIYGDSAFVENASNIYKYSVKSGGNYTIHEDGAYTFNLVLDIDKSNWDCRYAVKSYIKYTYGGKSYTVYDNVYSSRSVKWIAEQVVNSPLESGALKQYFENKILNS